MASDERVQAVGVALPPSLIRATTLAAAWQGQSRSAFIRDAIRKSLAEKFGDGTQVVREIQTGGMGDAQS